MKAVYVTSESYIDHSFTIVKELSKHIDLRVFIQAREKTEEIESWCNSLNAVFIQRRRFRNPLSLFSELAFIFRLKKINPDIVWFNTLTVYQLLFVKMLIKNFLVTVHDVEIHPGAGGHGNIAAKLTLKFALKNVCVVSKTQANIFKKNFGFEPKVFQLPIIDYHKEVSSVKSEREPKNTIRFFFFGSIEEYKGVGILLEAGGILEKKNVKFKLNIYGKIKYDEETLKKRIKTLKNITLFNEFVDYKEVHKIYIENDVLVLPYKQVTQCGPLLIAYEELVPVICSDLEGFREYVEDNISGIIFNNSPQDLADKMIFFIEHPELISKIRIGIKENAHSRFLMRNLCKGYLENLTAQSGLL
ncbi:MAG: glycosyltransferase family 4 protein [Chlorobi bacterium]|nr:glycosyltransferase family 4 protein [Chlorobiota bacterium]MCI0716084.1 glycosyltransferase family 4 protein [Chlorobiota bacterium]